MNTDNSSNEFTEQPEYRPKEKTNSYEITSDNSTYHSDTTDSLEWISEGTQSHYSVNRSDLIKVTVFDVAQYVLKKLGEITTMKLHKILYYCQAWSLVWDEKVLFDEQIEAWANGPVIRELFAFHRGKFKINSLSVGNAEALSQDQLETIDSVLDFYGDKSSQWLIELTHMEDPWKTARTGLKSTDRGSREITLDSMAQYYSSL